MAPATTRPALVAAVGAWAILLAGVLVGIAQPRWYLLNDWRESVLRAAFFVVIVLVPALAVFAAVLVRRRDALWTAPDRWARRLAVTLLVLLGLAVVGLSIAYGTVQGAG